MNKYIEKIQKYLEEEEIEYTYNPQKEMINIEVVKTLDGDYIYEHISKYDDIIRVSIQTELKLDNSTQIANIQNKVSEYIHRVNLDMIRGSFEYDFDSNIIRFKHYLEKNILSNKDYTIYNIILPVVMFQRYFNGIIETISTNRPPKEIVDDIETKVKQEIETSKNTA